MLVPDRQVMTWGTPQGCRQLFTCNSLACNHCGAVCSTHSHSTTIRQELPP